MGPLTGYKIIEVSGIGPGPLAGMLLADLGAEVIRIDRFETDIPGPPSKLDITGRNKKSIRLNLKSDKGKDIFYKLLEDADALIEGFRPGVMEKLGIGPAECLKINSKLIFGRITGWGQEGPLAKTAGHDINYISLIGALNAIGGKDNKPTIPLNLVGDYGGGALYLVVGVLAALLEAQKSGKGQVVDAAMVDGAASLMAAPFGMFAAGLLTKDRGSNVLDSGAYFYDSYECLDGKFVSIAAIESKFHSEMFSLMELDISLVQNQMDREHWPRLKKMMEEKFKTKTRDEWTSIMGGSDACFAPVLEMDEVAGDPHNAERETFINIDGVTQPAPAPRFSRTPNPDPTPPIKADMIELEDALDGWLSTEEISLWR